MSTQPTDNLPAEYAIIREALDQECTRTYAEGLAALGRLAAREPESRWDDEQMRAVIGIAHKHGWNGVDNSKLLSVFLDSLIDASEQSEIARLMNDVNMWRDSHDFMNRKAAEALTELAQARKATEEAQAEWAAVVEEQARQLLEKNAELRRAVDALRPFATMTRTECIATGLECEHSEAKTFIAAYDAKHGEGRNAAADQPTARS